MSDQYPPPPPPPPSRPDQVAPGQTHVPPGYASYQAPNPAAHQGSIASFGRRLGGYLLDGLIYSILGAVLVVPGIILFVSSFADLDCVDDPIGGTSCTGDLRAGSFVGGLALLALGFLVVMVLYIWQLARSGQTFGRRIVGVKVIDERSGRPPSVGQALGRTLFANFISGQIFAIGYLWMLWDDKHQTLHDKVAKTHVVDV